MGALTGELNWLLLKTEQEAYFKCIQELADVQHLIQPL